MGTSKNTAVASSTKHIHVGTAHYAALYTANKRVDRAIPYIRLRGLWLAAAGFRPNDAVAIEVSDGRLVMTRT